MADPIACMFFAVKTADVDNVGTDGVVYLGVVAFSELVIFEKVTYYSGCVGRKIFVGFALG